MQSVKIQTFGLMLLICAITACNKDNLKKECDQSGCNVSDGFINPCICADLNTAFTLKNRPDRAIPEGVADVARYIVDEHNVYKFILFEVKDYRCDKCEQTSNDFYVKLAAIRVNTDNKGIQKIDTSWLYMGMADDSARVTPLGTSPVQNFQSKLEDYTIQFLSLEKIPGDYRLNLTTDYKEATFMISQ
jgi:hypothetical protein